MGGVVKQVTKAVSGVVKTAGGLVDQATNKKGGPSNAPRAAQTVAVAPPQTVDTFTKKRTRNPAKVALGAAKRGNNTNFSNAARVLRGS